MRLFSPCVPRSRALLLSLIMAGVALTAAAQQIPVAILGDPYLFGNAIWNEDIKAKLLSTGRFSKVDIYPIQTVTPVVRRLLAYKAVLVYTDSGTLNNSTALGDSLADYVDRGGGVVVAVFADATLPFGGRFATDDYWVIEPAGQAEDIELTLGVIHEPNSPLLAGVHTFNGGTSSYYGTGALNPAAVDVADWSNGAPLVARRVINGVNRVDLNFFPPSDSVRSDFWLATTDGAALMANALVYVASR